MMRNFFVLILCLVIAKAGFVQINFNYLQTDSLRNELFKAKHDTSRVLLMSGLAEAYRWSHSDSALYYGQNALALAGKINFQRGEANALISISVVQRELGNLAKALDLASKALAIAQGNFSDEEISALLRIANVYSASKDYDKALMFLHQAEEKSRLSGNQVLENISQWLVAAALEQKNELDSARDYANKALKNWSWDQGAGYAYNILADIQLKLNEDSLALHNYWLGLEAASRTKDYRTTSNLNISLANYYKTHHHLDSAVYYGKRALDDAQLLSYKNRIISSSRILAEIYELKDPNEALRYYKIFNAAKDSLYGADKMLALQKLMIDEQEKQKEAEAKQLAYQNQLKQYGLLAGLLAVFVILILLYRNNRRKQKANNLLEKQKREIEEQRARAEIETALEKVRTIAMSMRKPGDMLEVCKVISEQLAVLGIQKVRNVQTAIFYEDKGVYTNYEFYVKHEKAIITETEFRNHPVAEAFAGQMMKGANEFFAHSFSGSEVKDWLEYQKGTNVFIDEYLETATSLSYYWYSLGPIALGISTYEVLSLADQEIFKRFRNVFELSYRRYLDIEKAEAQTRESQIQLALERVRARTMAMQHSDELADTAQILFQQFKQLGEDPIQITIGIFNEPQNVIEFRITGGNGSGLKIDQTFKASIDEPTLMNKIFRLWKENKRSATISLEGEELSAWIKYRNVMSGEYAYQTKVQTGESRHVSVGFFSKGVLSISSMKVLPAETIQILERFASVFDQTYTRFLDLQKAELQAKEAQIEAALEKVRGKAMAMHNSNDLAGTASMVFTELRRLGIRPIRCGVGLLNKASRTGRLYSATSSANEDDLSLVGWVHLEKHPVLEAIYDTWLDQKDYFPELQGEQLRAYYKLLLAGLSVPIPDFTNDQKQFGHFIPFSVGCLYAWSDVAYDENETKILRRFASIIDLTFRRYLELQQSEANTKEAIKQAALDRIRADIASMRTVSDLDRITPLIWNELTTLNLPFIRCGVFIMDGPQELIHTFLSTPDGRAIAAFHIPYDTPGNIGKVLKHWKEKTAYISHWAEVDFIAMADILVRQGTVSRREEYLETLPKNGFHLHFVPFLQGMFYVGSLNELNKEQIELLHQVAETFSTAYARYEDFNKLEAAKKQVDITLNELKATQQQLIQSEKMASLGELTAGIAHEIQNPLNFVNNFSEVSAELMDEIKSELDKGDIVEAKFIAGDVKQNLEKIAHHGKRADAIVKSMLQHSRKSAGQKDLVDLNSLVDEYLRMSYHGFRAKDKSFNAILETHFDPEIKDVNIIGQDVGRVLLNLFNNAFYAVNEKKKEKQNGFEPTVQVTTSTSANIIEIKVKDNGKGIPEKVLGKIYQPFFTTKPTGEGTGLGLSLSYDIITKGHGGELKVKTKEGEWSEFIIQLPNLPSL